MAISKAQKLKAATLLGSGLSEVETSKQVGVSRSTIQSWKRKKDFCKLIREAQEETGKQALVSHGQKVLRELNAIKEREPQIRENVWGLLDSMTALTQGVLDRASSEEISVRSLPALTESVCRLAKTYTEMDDRIGNLEVIASVLVEKNQ